jgi:hypothetical protein
LSTVNRQPSTGYFSIKLRYQKDENERDAYTLEFDAGTPGSDTGTCSNWQLTAERSEIGIGGH